jgi:hypothetical protein
MVACWNNNSKLTILNEIYYFYFSFQKWSNFFVFCWWFSFWKLLNWENLMIKLFRDSLSLENTILKKIGLLLFALKIVQAKHYLSWKNIQMQNKKGHMLIFLITLGYKKSSNLEYSYLTEIIQWQKYLYPILNQKITNL